LVFAIPAVQEPRKKNGNHKVENIRASLVRGNIRRFQARKKKVGSRNVPGQFTFVKNLEKSNATGRRGKVHRKVWCQKKKERGDL